MVEVQLLFWAIILPAAHVPAPTDPESKPAWSILNYSAPRKVVRGGQERREGTGR